MRFVSVRDLRGKSAEIWKDLAGEREMVITSNGRPVAILAAVNEATLEESLSAFRQSRAVDAVSRLQRASASHGTDTLCLEDIEAEIKTIRGRRHE
jgi:antitoxin (DNA-binding transcriptional repressor) of toxin-antitoxin stability system